MTIYSIKSLDGQECELFTTLDAMAKWLRAKKPVDGKLVFRHREDEYRDITAANLEALLNRCRADGQAPVIIIRRDFFIRTIETEYVYTTINVNE